MPRRLRRGRRQQRHRRRRRRDLSLQGLRGGQPRAGQSCRNAQQCNISISTSFQCVANTNAAGVPTGFGDDVCGDGQTDENVNADFGTQATSLLQRRNFDVSAGNGVGDAGRGAGDPRFNTLEDLYGPEGQAWQGEVGLLVSEPEGNTAAVPSYGIGIDDMVLQWKEIHPIGQTVATCSVANPQYEGTCAQLALGVAFNTNDGDGEIEVSVIDFNAASTENAVDCNGDSQALEVEVEAFSEAERIPEIYCLEQASPGSKQYRGVIKTTTRVNQAGDGLVYLAFNGSDTPSITARYLDKNDGLNGFNNGPDGQPGVAGVDDDDDGTVDNASELCPVETSLGPGRSPHIPGTAVRYSDDKCGCLDNPIADSTFAAFDPAGVILVSHDVDDSACTGCDNDGFADPGEQVKINVTIRNQGDFPLVNVELSAFTTSNLVECLTDDRIVIDRLEKRGEPGDEFTTSVDSFSFVAARGINRGAAGDKFGSEWTLGLRALGKAEPTSSLQFDVPISSTLVVQSFFVPHNLSAPATTAIATTRRPSSRTATAPRSARRSPSASPATPPLSWTAPAAKRTTRRIRRATTRIRWTSASLVRASTTAKSTGT
ncbi:MAG: hypothetical protein HC882_01325 [Acidobacteria bacterium]|nr:hypothetical protein [Acidobacteriota bacterium]